MVIGFQIELFLQFYWTNPVRMKLSPYSGPRDIVVGFVEAVLP